MTNLQRCVGRVKWFNPVKGFGFVASDEGGPDILLHLNVLRSFGQGTISDGAVVELLAQKSERGMQAVEVLSIRQEDAGAEEEARVQGIAIDSGAAGPLEPAKVKWFDKMRGFGFANVFGKSEDIFMHMEVLRRSNLSALQPGEAICIRVMDGRRGKMAAEILTWEAAIGSQD